MEVDSEMDEKIMSKFNLYGLQIILKIMDYYLAIKIVIM